MQILFKLLNSGYLSDMHGCISTGKEANVYHASTANGEDLAIKIYKTSILVFKDRDRYAFLSNLTTQGLLVCTKRLELGVLYSLTNHCICALLDTLYCFSWLCTHVT